MDEHYLCLTVGLQPEKGAYYAKTTLYWSPVSSMDEHYLCLTVGLQPEKGANLEVPGVNDAGAHVVLRVRVNVLKKLQENVFIYWGRVRSLLFSTPVQCHPFFSILRDVWIQAQRPESQKFN